MGLGGVHMQLLVLLLTLCHAGYNGGTDCFTDYDDGQLRYYLHERLSYSFGMQRPQHSTQFHSIDYHGQTCLLESELTN